jgi:hypothetical protein
MKQDRSHHDFMPPRLSASRGGRHSNVAGLGITQGERITAKAKLDRITQRRAADDFNTRAIAKAHLQKPPPKLRIAPNRNHAPAATDAELIQPARFRWPGMVTTRKVTSLLHIESLRSQYNGYRNPFHPKYS